MSIYVKFDESGNITNISMSKYEGPSWLAVSNSTFSKFPPICWEVIQGELQLKSGYEQVLSDFLLENSTTTTSTEVLYAKISPVQFKMLFNSAERLGVKSLISTDTIIADFYEIIEDPRLEVVDFNLQSTRDGVRYLLTKLVEQGILVTDQIDTRYEEITSGILK